MAEIIDTAFGEAVIKEHTDGRWVVVFIDTGFRCMALKKDIDSDVVIDYLAPRVCGVGFGDYYQPRLSDFTTYVSLWKGILRDVYIRGEGTIDPVWHDFREFRRDFKRVAYSKPFIRDGIGELRPLGGHYSRETLKVWLKREAI